MKFKGTGQSNIIDFNSVKKTVKSKTNNKFRLINSTTILDEDMLDLMKNEFDYYLNKESEVFIDGSSKK